jgi:hypothetical protein
MNFLRPFGDYLIAAAWAAGAYVNRAAMPIFGIVATRYATIDKRTVRPQVAR